jgi:lysophospholipase L1-like esterase
LIEPAYQPDPALRIDAQYARVGVTVSHLEIEGARSIVEGLVGQVNAHDVARGYAEAGYRGCWVLALGTTDAANVAAGSGVGRAERIDRMMAVIGDAPVLWVNTRTLLGSGVWSDAQMQAWNADLEAAAPRYPTMRIYDWAAVARDEWYIPDGIHYSTSGYGERSQMIADALAAAFPRSPCVC